MITIGYSTRESKPQFKEYVSKTCGLKNVEIIEVVNNGEKSLPQVYNELINQSSNDICVFCHDDIEFETNNWGNKLLKVFSKNPEFGIIGVAGSKFLPVSGRWWDVNQTMYGIVNHKHEGKKWTSTYSKPLNKPEEVVLIDGLFMCFDKTKIKHKFDEQFEGFHFYDLSFCTPNYLDGVKIGVTTDIRLTHLSIGATNQSWEDKRKQFVEKYNDNLPIDITNVDVCETFIFCHDQDIILEYEQSGKFNNLNNLKYVFLGNKSIDKIDSKDNVIIARNLPFNIEQYPTFNAYTGWYCLWKNNLITKKYVNLFEYDIIINPNLQRIISKLMFESQKMIGYIPFPCNNFHFIDNKEWTGDLFDSIRKVYKIDLEKTIRSYMRKKPNMLWSSTSNCTMNVDFFNSYMKWFEPIAENLYGIKTAGHAHERSTTFFSLMYKHDVYLTQNLIKHYQMDSHGTQGHFVDYNKNINELITNKLS